LLRTIGVHFELYSTHVDEQQLPGESPVDYIMRLARAKASEAARAVQEGLVIGADTVVVHQGQIFGKPADEQNARSMLAALSGKWHAVLTALVLRRASSGEEAAGYEKTLVRFAEITEAEINWYVRTGEPLDKAGAYGIQGKGSLLVEQISGNYHNVVGLPLPLLNRLARELGLSLINDLSEISAQGQIPISAPKSPFA
jgi:septum formation protein